MKLILMTLILATSLPIVLFKTRYQRIAKITAITTWCFFLMGIIGGSTMLVGEYFSEDMNFVFYLSLFSVLVLPFFIWKKNLDRESQIIATTTWGFFAVVLFIYVSVSLTILYDEMMS